MIATPLPPEGTWTAHVRKRRDRDGRFSAGARVTSGTTSGSAGAGLSTAIISRAVVLIPAAGYSRTARNDLGG
jgi:hypothetical protein